MSLSHGNWKQIFDVFRFWELSFSGIFVKLSKEWHPPEWFVPSHNVSLQKLVWHSHSNLFFSLSLLLLHFFFLLPRALYSHWPFIAPPQAATITPVVTITSNHHEISSSSAEIGPSFFFSLSLSFLPLPDWFLSQALFLSLIPFAISLPSWATTTSHYETSSSSAQIEPSLFLSLFPPFVDRFLSQAFFLSFIPFAKSVHLYV